MAGDNIAPESYPTTTRSNHQSDLDSNRIARLRKAAQEHLEEIDQETEFEQMEEARKQSENERYIRRRRSPKSKSTVVVEPSDSKAPSMRTAQDVLDRLRWDQSLEISHFRVGYLERFDGLREMEAASWIKESTDEDWIPQHRIKYFKKVDEDGNGEIVWHRDDRIDKIFGSVSEQAQPA